MLYNRREAVEAKHLETQLMKPPTAFEAEIQSDVESDAEFRSWSEELQMQKVRLSCCTNPMMLEVMRNEKSEAQPVMT